MLTKSIIGLTNLCNKFIQKQPFTMFFKINILKNFAIFTGKKLRWSLYFIKLQAFGPGTFLKRDSNMFFCEYCEIFKNSYFPVTTSVLFVTKFVG